MNFLTIFLFSGISGFLTNVTFKILTNLKLSAFEAEEICNRAGGTLPFFPEENDVKDFINTIGKQFKEHWLGIDWLPREHFSIFGRENHGCNYIRRNEGFNSAFCDEKKNFVCRFEGQKNINIGRQNDNYEELFSGFSAFDERYFLHQRYINPTESPNAPQIAPVIKSGIPVTIRGKYPWLVSIWRKKGSKRQHNCGGTILNKHWILTAAHCNVRRSDRLVLGQLENQTTRKIFVNVKSVREVVNHPKSRLVNEHNFWSYDFALVRINGEIEFDEFIRPIALPERYFSDENCTVAGWGETENEARAISLIEAQLTIHKKGECEPKGWQRFIDESSFCAAGSASVCGGDSGGPIFCKDETGRSYVAGVTSWSSMDCLKNAPSGFGDVMVVRHWIKEIITQF